MNLVQSGKKLERIIIFYAKVALFENQLCRQISFIVMLWFNTSITSEKGEFHHALIAKFAYCYDKVHNYDILSQHAAKRDMAMTIERLCTVTLSDSSKKLMEILIAIATESAAIAFSIKDIFKAVVF